MRVVFVTKKSIYWIEDGICSRVHSRESNSTVQGHAAVGSYLTGSFLPDTFCFTPAHERAPRSGEHLCFTSHGGTIVSSPIERSFDVYDGKSNEPVAEFDDDDLISSSCGGR